MKVHSGIRSLLAVSALVVSVADARTQVGPQTALKMLQSQERKVLK